MTTLDNVLRLLPLTDEFKACMIDEIVGDFNTHETRKVLEQEGIIGEPTVDQCAWHFVTHGGVAGFRQKYAIPLDA